VLPVLQEKITGGTMGEYQESPEAHETLVNWIEVAAPESEWPTAKAVLDAHCVHATTRKASRASSRWTATARSRG